MEHVLPFLLYLLVPDLIVKFRCTRPGKKKREIRSCIPKNLIICTEKKILSKAKTRCYTYRPLNIRKATDSSFKYNSVDLKIEIQRFTKKPKKKQRSLPVHQNCIATISLLAKGIKNNKKLHTEIQQWQFIQWAVYIINRERGGRGLNYSSLKRMVINFDYTTIIK